MAKKLTWGTFSIEHLRVDEDDDIYANFPFLNLVGMKMVKTNELILNKNAVRGINDTDTSKLVGLSASLFYGWDRTSFPIPYIVDERNLKEIFDRRHTVTSCQKIKSADEVPGAEYERAYPSNGGIFNDFLYKSILTMASMHGNVYGPIVEDTKDHMFETACVRIIEDEQTKSIRSLLGQEEHDDNLVTRSFIRKLLKNMGCFTRYNNNDMVINRIVGRVINALQDEQSVVGKLGINNNEDDIINYINENSDKWGQHNTEDDNYIYVVQQIRDLDTFCYTYAERALTRVCVNERDNPKKITKILLWNKSEAAEPKKVVGARNRFKKRLNSSWQARRNNVLKPVGQILNDDIIPYKKLSELKLEIWNMHQIDGEDEPFQMVFDDE